MLQDQNLPSWLLRGVTELFPLQNSDESLFKKLERYNGVGKKLRVKVVASDPNNNNVEFNTDERNEVNIYNLDTNSEEEDEEYTEENVEVETFQNKNKFLIFSRTN